VAHIIITPVYHQHHYKHKYKHNHYYFTYIIIMVNVLQAHSSGRFSRGLALWPVILQQFHKACCFALPLQVKPNISTVSATYHLLPVLYVFTFQVTHPTAFHLSYYKFRTSICTSEALSSAVHHLLQHKARVLQTVTTVYSCSLSTPIPATICFCS
jgi:hypothetical protein